MRDFNDRKRVHTGMEVGVTCAMTLSTHHMAEANRATPEHKINIAPAAKSNQVGHYY
jgi:hypothetical protein